MHLRMSLTRHCTPHRSLALLPLSTLARKIPFLLLILPVRQVIGEHVLVGFRFLNPLLQGKLAVCVVCDPFFVLQSG
jgi:hypothetical protein